MDDKSTPKRLLVTGVGIRRGMGHWFAGNSYVIGDEHADVTVTELPDEPTPGLPTDEQMIEALARLFLQEGYTPLGAEELARRAVAAIRSLAPAPEPTPGLVEAARTMLRLWETSETVATWREGFEALRAALEAMPDDVPDEWEETDSTGYGEANRADKPRRRATTYDGGTAEERYWVKRSPIPAEPPIGSIVRLLNGNTYSREPTGWYGYGAVPNPNSWELMMDASAERFTVLYTPAVES